MILINTWLIYRAYFPFYIGELLLYSFHLIEDATIATFAKFTPYTQMFKPFVRIKVRILHNIIKWQLLKYTLCPTNHQVCSLPFCSFLTNKWRFGLSLSELWWASSTWWRLATLGGFVSAARECTYYTLWCCLVLTHSESIWYCHSDNRHMSLSFLPMLVDLYMSKTWPNVCTAWFIHQREHWIEVCFNYHPSSVICMLYRYMTQEDSLGKLLCVSHDIPA